MNKIIIIAEAGVNHNGKIKNAKKLVDLAVKSGANYIKFQYYKSEKLVSNNTKLAPYQKKNLKKKVSQLDMLRKYELKAKDIEILYEYSKKKKINFLCTPFDIESAKHLIKIGIKEFKIASPDLDNFPLIKFVAKKAKKIFLSTGMSNFEDVKRTIKFIKKNSLKNNSIYLMHCTSDYPAQKSELNLLVINLFQEYFKLHVGYSDHTIGNEASMIAVALGATVIEKHITLNKKMSGPDHKASMQYKEFKKFINYLKQIIIMKGIKEKKITLREKQNFKSIKRSIYLTRDIKMGKKLILDDFECKRPSNDIKLINWDKILGRKARKNYKRGEAFK